MEASTTSVGKDCLSKVIEFSQLFFDEDSVENGLFMDTYDPMLTEVRPNVESPKYDISDEALQLQKQNYENSLILNGEIVERNFQFEYVQNIPFEDVQEAENVEPKSNVQTKKKKGRPRKMDYVDLDHNYSINVDGAISPPSMRSSPNYLTPNFVPKMKKVRRSPKCDPNHPPASVIKENYREYKFDFGWKKILMRREGGNTKGHWDLYWLPPYGKRLRSMTELEKYIAENPEIEYDPLILSGRPSDLPNPSQRKMPEQVKSPLKSPRKSPVKKGSPESEPGKMSIYFKTSGTIKKQHQLNYNQLKSLARNPNSKCGQTLKKFPKIGFDRKQKRPRLKVIEIADILLKSPNAQKIRKRKRRSSNKPAKKVPKNPDFTLVEGNSTKKLKTENVCLMKLNNGFSCGLKFNTHLDLMSHQVFHGKNLRLYQCGLCEMRFDLISKLSKHMNSDECVNFVIESKYPELKNESSTNMKDAENVPKPKKKSKNIYHCSKCGFESINQNTLIEHFNIKHLPEIENDIAHNDTKEVQNTEIVQNSSEDELRKRRVSKPGLKMKFNLEMDAKN